MDDNTGVQDAGKHSIAVMGKEGDTKYMWDKDNAAEVEIAKSTFDSFKKKGYAAFKAIGDDGKKGELIKEFDPNIERIIFVPALRGG